MSDTNILNITSCVLIVPLWNWNKKNPDLYELYKSFNRTFMELK